MAAVSGKWHAYSGKEWKGRRMNMEALYWLIAVAVLLLIEILTLGLTTIWFAGGALAAFLAALLHGPLYLQFFVFIVVSFVLLMFTRPVAVKYFNQKRVRTNVDALIGKECRVLEEINNFKGTGRVDVGGQEWTARQALQKNEEESIPAGEAVIITAVSGVKLLVKQKEGALGK